MAPSPAGREDRQPATAVSRFHGEFKSQRLDPLYRRESLDNCRFPALEKNANIGQNIFDRPPTGSYEGTPAPQPHIYETHPAGIDAGTVATAIFTLGLVIDRAARRAVEYYEKHAKGS